MFYNFKAKNTILLLLNDFSSLMKLKVKIMKQKQSITGMQTNVKMFDVVQHESTISKMAQTDVMSVC